MYCNNCGNPDQNHIYCNRCGQKLDTAGKDAQLIGANLSKESASKADNSSGNALLIFICIVLALAIAAIFAIKNAESGPNAPSGNESKEQTSVAVPAEEVEIQTSPRAVALTPAGAIISAFEAYCPGQIDPWKESLLTPTDGITPETSGYWQFMGVSAQGFATFNVVPSLDGLSVVVQPESLVARQAMDYWQCEEPMTVWFQ